MYKRKSPTALKMDLEKRRVRLNWVREDACFSETDQRTLVELDRPPRGSPGSRNKGRTLKLQAGTSYFNTGGCHQTPGSWALEAASEERLEH